MSADPDRRAGDETPPRPSATAAAGGRRTRARLGELALFFLRLGLTAFGGPAAHIALMEAVAVRERRWLSRERFLDLLAAANLIPGPTSTELAIYLGYERAGIAGLLVGGVCFILPAALITVAFAWAYLRVGHLPQAAAVLYGIKPVIIAVVAQALWTLSRAALKNRVVASVGVLALVAAALQIRPLIILLVPGWSSEAPSLGSCSGRSSE